MARFLTPEWVDELDRAAAALDFRAGAPVAVEHVVETWQRFALIRHDGYMRPRDVAAAVMAMVSTARGSEVALIEIQPQAPTGQRVVRDNPAQQRVVRDNPAQH